ncbi:MAG: M13 family metallopeptidase [Sinobacteraceae bacterium]|nr:M13 family metallopeptidase [Nevskiaceae bacterium]
MDCRRSTRSLVADLAAWLWVAIGLAIGLCLSGATASAAEEDQTKAAGSSLHMPGIDVAGMDRTVAPGDDFFQYANGTWLKRTTIPPDRTSINAFVSLQEIVQQRTRDLIERATHGSDKGETRKVVEYYASFMDEARIEQLGVQPLQPALASIGKINSREELARYLGSTLRADVDVLNATNLQTDHVLGVWVAQSLDDPSHYLPFLLQGGLELPDRDYYLNPSARMDSIRKQYQEHLARVLRLAKMPDSDANAARVFALEHRIAESHSSRADSEDVKKGNNHWMRAEFDKRAPGMDWNAFLGAAGLGKQSEFVVWHPRAVTALAALVASQPLEDWKTYLTVHALEHAAPFLPRAFVDERFAFYGKQLYGAEQLPDRWKRAVNNTNAALGDEVGKMYVAAYFPPAEKARAQKMVGHFIEAFRERIDHLEWMAPQTRQEAKAKLAALKVGVGYPDRWRDYSGLQILAGDALGNAERAELFDYHYNLAKLGHAVDRGEWVMTPQTINAVNLPAMNALNFPAGMLQPPYFDPQRPDVMDYGAIGQVIGHEISHSFDDQGAQFDAQGRLRNWWTPADLERFHAASARLVQQYNNYHPFPDLALNGQQTLSENIADVAGLAVAYDAYRLAHGGKEAPAMQGFSGDQQFFLSFAQVWRNKDREAALRDAIITDAHSPPEYRVDTVRNQDAWYRAFSVKPDNRLYLSAADRVHVW